MSKQTKPGVHADEAIENVRMRLAQFERELQALSERLREQNVSALMEEEELRRDVVRLEDRLSRLEEQTNVVLESLGAPEPGQGAMDKGTAAPFGARFLLDNLKVLQERVKHMEGENRTLAETCDQLRQQNEEISNLYVAKHRLHATFHPVEVMRIIEEILAELVGAKEFGILIMERKKTRLRVAAGRGVESRLPSKTVSVGEGIIGDVASTGKPFFFEPASPSERKAHLPLATIPLKMDDNVVGVVVIFELLDHKSRLTPVDQQLLELVAEHAPAALLSAHLYQSRTTKHPKTSLT